MRKLGLKARLLICDEAHRTAGIKRIPKDGERVRNFTLCHDKDAFPAWHRLYQTATPKVYSSASSKKYLRDEDDSEWDVRSMNDEDTFGPELHRISYVEAVERELLSDYRIVAWGISSDEADEARKIADQLNAESSEGQDTVRWDSQLAMRALTLAAFLSGCVEDVPIRSVIAFCNRVKISSELAKAVQSKPVQEWLQRYFQKLGLKKAPLPFGVEHVDASHPTNRRNEALYKLGNAASIRPYCISNVGIFGEGTDSPDLSAVAFLNPRKSPVDVIQAVGRAMRKSPKKTRGYILVPVVIPPGHDPENFLRNSKPKHGWEELGQILQALRAHDGRIEDELSDLMEFYLPPKPTDPADHIVVVKEPYQRAKIFKLNTKTPTILDVITPQSKDDTTSIVDRLSSDQGKLTKVVDESTLDPRTKPKSITAIRVDKEGKTFLKDLTYETIGISNSRDSANVWNPTDTINETREFIRREAARKNKEMKRVEPKPTSKLPLQDVLGLKLVKLEGDALAKSGIHLNLLEKSGIQSGSTRDVNLLQGTVQSVSQMLRQEGLERNLALKLGMENVDTSAKNAADACTVTSVIWFNAAITHVRLERAGLRELRNVPNLDKAVSQTTPALGILNAWGEVLMKDYVPIFKIARELLETVAFANIEGVSDALRRLAKDANTIADHYAQLGADHAGELFNKVMGNQRSDGAFFSRPIAASMLAELSLNAGGERDWLSESTWKNLRTFDPACGSGTILVAMMSAIKRRIKLAGGDENTLKKFHRTAVEELMIGADINHVALQLAACQLTLGDMSALYDRINLHTMEYGATDQDASSMDVKTGTIELLLDNRILPQGSDQLDLSIPSSNINISMKTDDIQTNLGDEMVQHPPNFVLMNPPFTSWTKVGSKFSTEHQHALRDRIGNIWDLNKAFHPLLENKKSSIEILFETLALSLTEKSSGVMGMVRPATTLTAEDSRQLRSVLATQAHIDYVLTCHDPMDFSMSWDTAIQECVIVLSKSARETGHPTTFINLHKFPSSTTEALETMDKAVKGQPFNGTSIDWDYQKMKEGDWSPSIFSECELVALATRAIENNSSLRCDLINSRIARGGQWRAGRFDI